MIKRIIKYLFILLLVSSNFSFSQNANDLIPKNEPFFIQSANDHGKRNTGYWDIPGGESNIREEAPIKVWELSDKAKDRRYAIVNSSNNGFVKIHIDGVAGYIDVKGGKNANGTKIQIYKPNNSSAQNFKFVYTGKGRFKIYNQNGKVIVLDGRKSKNGTEVQIWDDHDGSWTEWFLISAKTNKTLYLEDKIEKKGENMEGLNEFYIQSAINYGKNAEGFFDTPGSGMPNSGANVAAFWLDDFFPDRKFQIVNSSSDFSYYSLAISNNNNLHIDVSGNNNKNGTNIQLYGKNDSPAQNFYFKHLGNGRFKIYNQNGKIITLSNRSSGNNSNILIWDDHNGEWTEWYFIDTNTNKPFIPGKSTEIKSIKVSGTGKTAKTAAEIDKTYNRLNQLETKSIQAFSKIKSASVSIDQAYAISNDVNGLTGKVNNTYNALSSFSNIPVIGAAVTALSTSLNMAKSQLNKANSGLANIKQPVIDPAFSNLNFAKTSSIAFHSTIQKLKMDLFSAKNMLNTNPEKCGEISSKLSNINNALSKSENDLSEIEKLSASVSKVGGPINKVDSGIKNFSNAFNKADDAASEINDVLNKRFKKTINLKVKKIKINISLKDVLTGGKVGKAFKKFVNKWVSKLTKPLIKKLNIKIPTVPGIDEFKTAVNNSLDFTKILRQKSEDLNSQIEFVTANSIL